MVSRAQSATCETCIDGYPLTVAGPSDGRLKNRPPVPLSDEGQIKRLFRVNDITSKS
jgi:hypothetical protein